jgi:3'-5' exonuclease
MTHTVSAPGLSARPYFNRYTDDAVDLCDVLSSFAPNAKASLHELCRVLGLAGKPQGMDGGEVEKYYRDGRIKEIAEYCESDVINTYRVWLRYELFRGKMTKQSYETSEANLQTFLKARNNTTPQTIKTTEYDPAVKITSDIERAS